jgi:hypothetical protein
MNRIESTATTRLANIRKIFGRDVKIFGTVRSNSSATL